MIWVLIVVKVLAFLMWLLFVLMFAANAAHEATGYGAALAKLLRATWWLPLSTFFLSWMISGRFAAAMVVALANYAAFVAATSVVALIFMRLNRKYEEG